MTSRWRTVDVNGGHLVVCLLDVSGNPMGSPITLALQLRGSPAAARNGGGGERPAHSYRKRHHCTAVVIEEMDIAAAQMSYDAVFSLSSRSTPPTYSDGASSTGSPLRHHHPDHPVTDRRRGCDPFNLELHPDKTRLIEFGERCPR